MIEAARFQSTELRPLHRWALLLGTLILVQLIYWFVVHPWLFAATPRPALIKARDAAVAELISAEPEALANASFKPVELPYESCCAPGYRALRVYFDLEDVPPRGLALIADFNADNVRIEVNGTVAAGRGRMALPDISYYGNSKRIDFLPAALLKPGANELVLMTVRDASPYFGFSWPILGEYTALEEPLRHRNWFLNTYQMHARTIGALIAVLALVLAWRSSAPAFALWVALLVGAWSLRSAWFAWPEPPFSGWLRMYVYFASTALIPIAWLNVADQWTRHPIRHLARGSVALAAVVLVLLAIWFTNPGLVAYERASSLVDAIGIGFGALVVARFLWHLLRHREDRYVELALYLLLVSLMVIEFASEWRANRALGYLNASLPVILVAFVAAFLARNVRLFASVNEINALLREKLSAREAELAEQYAREAELIRRETLVDERSRLMGEIHDGIGGQLVSLIHANRREPLSPPEWNDALNGVLDELRFIIDSLDAVGASLSTALANFRRRIEPRLKAAGIQLRWRNELPADGDGYGPREVLQVCRIVQEAISNVIQHANASEISLTVRRDEASHSLCLSVLDNGRATASADSASGRGMKTMLQRAQSLNGTLQATAGAEGFRVELRAPWVDQPRASQPA